MRNKRRSRLVELGKDLLILLLALSMIFLLGRLRVAGSMADSLRGLLERNPVRGGDSVSVQTAGTRIRPMRVAVCQDGLRCGAQYDQEGVDAMFETLSVLFAEALSSVSAPEPVTESAWQAALCRTGAYLDFYYSVPFLTLADWLGDDGDSFALSGSVRRMCLAEDGNGGVSLFFINEDDGLYYAAQTTLSSEIHLTSAVSGWAPNGAQFAFETSGLESIEPYTLLTVTPEPLVYASDNPLLEDTTRVAELLSTLSFQSQYALNPTTGGQLVEQNDTLRLSSGGLVTFHTIGDSGYRFTVQEQGTQAAVRYVQSLAQATVGAWCGDARLCLAQVREDGGTTEIVFQYSIDGAPVILTESEYAARFLISDGVITDFSLYLRAYSQTEESTLVLPVVQAAAALEAMAVEEKELTLIYRDTGGEQISAGWAAM